MTIPYDATMRAMRKYLIDQLNYLFSKDNEDWFNDGSSINSNLTINSKDIVLLVNIISNIVCGDFEKIPKLT